MSLVKCFHTSTVIPVSTGMSPMVTSTRCRCRAPASATGLVNNLTDPCNGNPAGNHAPGRNSDGFPVNGDTPGFDDCEITAHPPALTSATTVTLQMRRDMRPFYD